MLMSIIVATAVAFFAVTAAEMLSGSETETRKGLGIGTDGWARAIILGLIVGVVNFSAPKLEHGTLWLAPICLVAMLGVYAHLMRWWHREGSEWTEMIPFAILAILVFFPAKAAAAATTALWNSVFWTSVINVLPTMFLVATLGFYVINYFYFRYREVDLEEDDLERHRGLGILAIIVTTLLLIIILVMGVKWDSLKLPGRTTKMEANPTTTATMQAQPSGAPAEEKVDETESPWYFYNWELLGDDDASNDFNFGPNPYKAEYKTAEDYDQVFRERLRRDPILGAGTIAWLDANLGTRYLGEFYESCKGDWAKTINQAKETWLNDPEAYGEVLDAVFLFMDTAKVECRYEASGLDDQMYMNPYTVNGVPDIIVMRTLNHDGWFLVYTFTIKGQLFEVAYRMECGFQPTNVEKVMGITPQDIPEKPETTPEPGPGPTPTPGPGTNPTPTPNPTPAPSSPPYNKDKTKGTKENTEPNDDPGPGPDTNNGVGAQESTKDQPTNSNHSTYDEYRDWVEDMAETNHSQKTGGDPNTPSTTPAPGTNVDDNADNGTGYGGIDTPTSVAPPAVEAGTGQEISDSPGGIWGGPQD